MDWMHQLGHAQRFISFFDTIYRQQVDDGVYYMDRAVLDWGHNTLRTTPAALVWDYCSLLYKYFPPPLRSMMDESLRHAVEYHRYKTFRPQPTPRSVRRVAWLHISDLHCLSEPDYDQDTVLGALWSDIRTRGEWAEHALDDLDFICCTGDLAYHGEEEEYEFIEEKILPNLFLATGLNKSRLLIVPGNHDICQRRVTNAARGAQERLLDDSRRSSSPITTALTRPAERAVYFSRLEAYLDFFQRTFDVIELDEEGYFYVQRLALPSGAVIAILGLNSAWLSYGGESDRGRLVLGEYQVCKAIRRAREMNPDLLIALTHHPFEWLAENADLDQVKQLLHRKIHFALHGHRHRNEAYRVDALHHILAGASYADRYSPIPNSYNLVTVNLSDGRATVYFRRYSEERRGWIEDVHVPGTSNGRKTLFLDDQLIPWPRTDAQLDV